MANIAAIKGKNKVQRLHKIAKIRKTDEDAWNKWRQKRNNYNKLCAKASADCWKKDMAELETISETARLQRLLENRGSKIWAHLKERTAHMPEIVRRTT